MNQYSGVATKKNKNSIFDAETSRRSSHVVVARRNLCFSLDSEG